MVDVKNLENVYPSDPDIRHKKNFPQTEAFYRKRLRIWKPAVVETEWCHGSLFLGLLLRCLQAWGGPEGRKVSPVPSWKWNIDRSLHCFHRWLIPDPIFSVGIIRIWNPIGFSYSCVWMICQSNINSINLFVLKITEATQLRVVLSYAFPKPTSHCHSIAQISCNHDFRQGCICERPRCVCLFLSDDGLKLLWYRVEKLRVCERKQADRVYSN